MHAAELSSLQSRISRLHTRCSGNNNKNSAGDCWHGCAMLRNSLSNAG